MAVFKSNDPRRTRSPWAVSFTGPDGKPKLLYRKTRKAADALLAKSSVAVTRGEYQNPSQARTVAELVSVFLAASRARVADGTLKPATLADYEAQARLYILPMLGRVTLRALTREHAERLRSDLLSKPSAAVQDARATQYALRGGTAAAWRSRLGSVGPRTVGKVLGLLVMLLENAIARDWTHRNVARGISRGGPQLQSIDAARVLTDAEVGKLLDRADGQLRVMLLTSLRTGVRLGELLGLVWSDIDLTGRRLHVRRALHGGIVQACKTRHSTRTLPIDDVMLRELRTWKLACPVTAERLVFPGPGGGHYSEFMPLKRLRALLRRCGFERPELAKFRWHDLRHCAASHMLASGMTLLDVSRQLGHSTPAVTATVYSHALPDREVERRGQLSMLYGRG